MCSEKAINKMEAIQKEVDLSIERSVSKEVVQLETMTKYFLDKMGINEQQLQLIKTWYPNITAGEISYGLEFSKTTGLDILNKEMWLVRRGGYQTINGKKEWVEKYEPMIGIDGARKIARLKATEQGKEYQVKTWHSIESIPTITEDKEGFTTFEMKEDLVFYAQIDDYTYAAPFNSIAQRSKEKALNRFWKTEPLHMGLKVVEFRAIKAYYGLNGASFEVETQVENVEFEEVKKDIEHLTESVTKALLNLPEKESKEIISNSQASTKNDSSNDVVEEIVDTTTGEIKEVKEEPLRDKFISLCFAEDWQNDDLLEFAKENKFTFKKFDDIFEQKNGYFMRSMIDRAPLYDMFLKYLKSKDEK